jgi:uncharacterized protein involved in response to NO
MVGRCWVWLSPAMLDADLPLSAAINALTVGAIGATILAVMTRVTRVTAEGNARSGKSAQRLMIAARCPQTRRIQWRGQERSWMSA